MMRRLRVYLTIALVALAAWAGAAALSSAPAAVAGDGIWCCHPN